MENFNYLLHDGFRVIKNPQKNVAICLHCKKIFANCNNLHLLEHRNYCNIKKRNLLVEASNQPKRLRKTIIHDEMIRTNSDLEKSTEFLTTNSQQHEIPISAPATTTQQQHQLQQQPPDPFESYTTTSAVDIDNDIEEVDDEDLINIEEELDVIQTLMPRSKESLQLQDELSRVEAEYYRNKAAYFAKLTENSKIKRTLMLLQSRKLQLEIEKLTSES